MYRAYELVEGFPSTRAEVATALAGTAVANTWGAKLKPTDLIPDFRPMQILEYKRGAEIFKAFAQAHNKRNKRINGKRNRKWSAGTDD